MESPQIVIEHYLAAWNAPDEAGRRAALERAWTDGGTYTDPTAHVAGREAFAGHIGDFAARLPGAQFALTSAVDAHHGLLRFGWQLAGADGEVMLEGIDFGELAEDGRLRRIVGFFGPLPTPGATS